MIAKTSNTTQVCENEMIIHSGLGGAKKEAINDFLKEKPLHFCRRLFSGSSRRPWGLKTCKLINFTFQSEIGILSQICLFSWVILKSVLWTAVLVWLSRSEFAALFHLGTFHWSFFHTCYVIKEKKMLLNGLQVSCI